MTQVKDNPWLDDLDDDEKPVIPDDTKTQQLAILADHYVSMENEINAVENELAGLKERFRRLREDIIPDKMQSFGVKKLTLPDNSSLGYDRFYAGKILDDGAYDFLESVGYPDAVKQELKLEVSRVDNRVLAKIKEWVAKMVDADDPEGFDNLSVKEKQSVHHMTLSSLIKSLNKQGRDLPKDLFDVYIGYRATLKKGKPE